MSSKEIWRKKNNKFAEKERKFAGTIKHAEQVVFLGKDWN
jgi:hypothetical protein